jgi:hypothetical protein
MTTYHYARTTDPAAPAVPLAEMPVKRNGQHRWVAMACYTLSEADAAAMDEKAVTLGPERLVSFHVGCYDCERPYEQAVGAPCESGDEWGLTGDGD